MEIERVYSDDPADWEAVAEFLIKFALKVLGYKNKIPRLITGE